MEDKEHKIIEEEQDTFLDLTTGLILEKYSHRVVADLKPLTELINNTNRDYYSILKMLKSLPQENEIIKSNKTGPIVPHFKDIKGL